MCEAQHHLSKLLDEVAAGEEIFITRRGATVARLVQSGSEEDPMQKTINWAPWAKGQRKFLEAMPMIEGSAVAADRENYHW